MNSFENTISDHIGENGLYGMRIDTIQANVGLICNQACHHCHVQASPDRKELMSWDVMDKIIEAADSIHADTIDITGGAPELNPNLKRFISKLREKDYTVQVRTNLTALLEENMEEYFDFYRDNRIQLVASLPCYLEENVIAQRGKGVYQKSIAALQRLNDNAYGIEPHLPLSLVYNPGGPVLPPNQAGLETSYKKELGERFGIRFTHLMTITNMPIGRFKNDLKKHNKDFEYMNLLKTSFNSGNLSQVMCRYQINVAWDGTLYDCDFNFAIGLPVNHGAPDHILQFDPEQLKERRIVTGDHCFGCTAGFGSSCQGALGGA